MAHTKEEEFGSGPFPRAPLLGASALILLALVAVAMVRLTGVGVSPNVPALAVETRDLRFEDRADGGIAAFDAADNRLVDIVAPGTNGFLRSTLRGLARERKRQGLVAELPYRLSGRADGRLTLEDLSTGRKVDLEAFGPTNAGAFARLLAAQGPTALTAMGGGKTSTLSKE